MEIYGAVARERSFTKAAGVLGVTRPVVSEAIKQLETHLGAKLLNRTTRKVNLTPEGEAYLRSCQDILDRIAVVEAEIAGQTVKPKGRLRVDVPPSIAKCLILPRLSEFLDHYPDIDLMMSVGDGFVDLGGSQIDCVIRVGRIDMPDVVARPLGEIAYYCCAAPEYLARHGRPETPDDLSDHKAINYFSVSTGRILPWVFRENDAQRDIRMEGVAAFNDAETCLQFALNGAGLVVVADFLAEPYLREGALQRVLADHPMPSAPLSLVYAPLRHQNRRLRVFLDWVKTLLETPEPAADPV